MRILGLNISYIFIYIYICMITYVPYNIDRLIYDRYNLLY
jgi:hypothetical protein